MILASFRPRLLPITYRIVRGTCEWPRIEVSKVCSRGRGDTRPYTGRQGDPHICQKERFRSGIDARARSRRERNAVNFSPSRARLSIRAPRDFYYPHTVERERETGQFTRIGKILEVLRIARDRGIPHWDSGVAHRRGVHIAIRATRLIFAAKICKARLN